MHHSVAVSLRSGQCEPGGRAAVSEQPLTGAEGQRVDEQVQVVDQAVGEQRRVKVPLPLT